MPWMSRATESSARTSVQMPAATLQRPRPGEEMVNAGPFFFFKQKTAYEITYGDWSSDVCSSDLPASRLVRFLRGTERPDVRDELPDLLRRGLGAPRRHPLGPAGRDRAKDSHVLPAIDPRRVAQARPHAAAAVVTVAAGAVVPAEQPTAFANRGRIGSVRVRGFIQSVRPRPGKRTHLLLDRGSTRHLRGVRGLRLLHGLLRRRGQQHGKDEDCGNGQSHSHDQLSALRGNSGTPYCSSNRWISCWRCSMTASRRARSESSPRRTAMEMSKTSGKNGKSICGDTGATSSGTVERPAKYPASGPHAIATSTSPRITASIKSAGGFGFE